MKNLDWRKIATLFAAFALATVIYDYFTIGIIDVYKTIGIPLIALGMVYLVDRKRLVKEE